MTFSDTPRKLVFRATKSELLSRQYSTLIKVCSFVTSRGVLYILKQLHISLLFYFNVKIVTDFSIEASFTEHQLVMKIFSMLLPGSFNYIFILLYRFATFIDILNLFIDMYVTNQRHNTSRWRNSNKDHLQNMFTNLFYWAIAPESLKIETQTEILSRVCEERSVKLILTPNDPLKQKKVNN